MDSLCLGCNHIILRIKHMHLNSSHTNVFVQRLMESHGALVLKLNGFMQRDDAIILSLRNIKYNIL